METCSFGGVTEFMSRTHCERIIPGTFNLLSWHAYNLSAQSGLICKE